MARLTAGAYAPEWKARAIGEIFLIRDDLPGQAPPAAVAGMRFIKLTAGENGAGQYNDGALINETVTGTAPLITATAEVAALGSALDGQVVNLLNTERRFIRAGAAGTLQDDEFKSHTHSVTKLAGNRGNNINDNYKSSYVGGTSGATGGDETRPRNIGATAYMRVL